jgi:putative transposase
VPLRTYQHFACRDPLSRLVLEQMLAGVSTRRFERTREPVGTEVEAVARSTSRSAVSRELVARTRENLIGLTSRRLDDVAAGWYCQTPEWALARPKGSESEVC